MTADALVRVGKRSVHGTQVSPFIQSTDHRYGDLQARIQ
jgi:hypothetical protein